MRANRPSNEERATVENISNYDGLDDAAAKSAVGDGQVWKEKTAEITGIPGVSIGGDGGI
ncbi:hypothetical protein [Leifsonia sp. RAF41]|uniref:hypothetical protein n=1 Tax=Leifsonia sp. RAF41 TaxID=3233056 RepID=UPI003F9C6C4D